MTQYYYLVASLPLLLFDDPPPFSSPAWMEMCREQLAKADHALLFRISFDALRPAPATMSYGPPILHGRRRCAMSWLCSAPRG